MPLARWWLRASALLLSGCSAILDAPTPALLRTGLRVLLATPAMVVVDKPAGLRSTPAFVGGEVPTTRKARWCDVAAGLDDLPPALRSHAAMLPRTRAKFLRFAAERCRVDEDAAARAWGALGAAVAARDAAEGVVETDSALRRVKEHVSDAARAVHRLDASTSGALAIALTAEAAAELSQQFRDRSVTKAYEAVVRGRIDSGTVDVPLERVDGPENLSKMVPATRDGKRCRTSYRVLEFLPGPDASVVELVPHTGRLHQLRAHMAFLGHPILGDDIYGDAPEGARLCLHSKALGFELAGESWRVESDCDWGVIRAS